MIIGIKERDKVVLAFSTFDGYSPVNSSDMVNAQNAGVWKIKHNRNTIMGGAYPTAESDIFRYEDKTFRGRLDYSALADSIVPDMEELVKGLEYIGDEKGRYEEFLIAQNDRLFHITTEHIVVEIDSSVVIGGAGDDVVSGALYATEGEPAIDRIRKALELAARKRSAECYPVCVMDTATGKLQVLTREN